MGGIPVPRTAYMKCAISAALLVTPPVPAAPKTPAGAPPPVAPATAEPAAKPAEKKPLEVPEERGNVVYFSPFGGYAFVNYNKKIYMPTPDGKEVKPYPGDLSNPLVKMLKGAKRSIDIASYIYNKDTAEHRALLAAGHRGVKVRLFLDSLFLDPFLTKDLKKYKNHIYVKTLDPEKAEKLTGIPFTTMHEKFGIIDGSDVYNGSANIDINANLKYTENRFFFYNSPEMVKAFQGEFDRLWEMGKWLFNPDEELKDEKPERKAAD